MRRYSNARRVPTRRYANARGSQAAALGGGGDYMCCVWRGDECVCDCKLTDVTVPCSCSGCSSTANVWQGRR